MRTSDQPRKLPEALKWIRSLKGEKRLCLVVDRQVNSPSFNLCLKAGKEITLARFKNNAERAGRDVSQWEIHTYQSAVKLNAANPPVAAMPPVPPAPPMVPAVRDARVKVNDTLIRVPGNDEIAMLIRNTISGAINPDAIIQSVQDQITQAIHDLVTPTIRNVLNNMISPKDMTSRVDMNAAAAPPVMAPIQVSPSQKVEFDSRAVTIE